MLLELCLPTCTYDCIASSQCPWVVPNQATHQDQAVQSCKGIGGTGVFAVRFQAVFESGGESAVPDPHELAVLVVLGVAFGDVMVVDKEC